MSSVWYRIRARNKIGTSEWSPIATASTMDASESIEVRTPSSLIYDAEMRRLIFEPLRPPTDGYCLLLYVSSGEDSAWRSLECFPTDRPIVDVEPMERFRARFCLRSDMTTCSGSVEINGKNSKDHYVQYLHANFSARLGPLWKPEAGHRCPHPSSSVDPGPLPDVLVLLL